MGKRQDANMDMADRGPMDQFSAHLERGWDLVTRGDFQGALQSAQKSLELDSRSAEAHNLLGYIQAAQGNAEDALEHYRQAIALDDTFVEAMLNAAEVLIHPLHDYEAAAGMVDEALELAQDDDELADALLVMFDAHMHQADHGASMRVAAKMPQGPFENPLLDFLVGRARFEVGDIEGAQVLLESAVERTPENPDAHYYMGMLLESKGDHNGAVVELLKSRALDLRVRPPAWSLPEDLFERRIRAAIEGLPQELCEILDGALVIVNDLPGVEVVAEGVDPRAGALLDELDKEAKPPRLGRVFVYKHNIERMAGSLLEVEGEIQRCLQHELWSLFPELAEVGKCSCPNCQKENE